ncbi:hypothetical protein XA68_16124 [Ophiocordyceps unilateralis]|uniref:Uncharacterized protein n=1 Tax=Ophiocordyceps unilateralis TaxID=268505 RepID=A0A2A9P760_OPHUN|nr:hypothetical protein XA68_16124 [Ophiocordyceps unilateralis]
MSVLSDPGPQCVEENTILKVLGSEMLEAVKESSVRGGIKLAMIVTEDVAVEGMAGERVVNPEETGFMTGKRTVT